MQEGKEVIEEALQIAEERREVKGKGDVFLELSSFFHDPADVGNLISGSSAFSKTSLNIWKFTVHVLPKPGLENRGC